MPPPRHLSVSPLARRSCSSVVSRFFVFTATATTQIYTLSLHDALPISLRLGAGALGDACVLRYGHDATRPRGARRFERRPRRGVAMGLMLLTIGFIVVASLVFAAFTVSSQALWAFPIIISLWTAFLWMLIGQ